LQKSLARIDWFCCSIFLLAFVFLVFAGTTSISAWQTLFN